MTSTRYLLAAVAAAPLLLSAACGDGGGFPDAKPIDSPPPVGTFSLAWSVTDANAQPVTCDAIGAQAVTATLRNPDIEGGFTEVFSCASLTGTSPGIAPGMYRVDFDLNGATTVLATSAQQMIEIKSGQNTALAPATFAVDATGALALTLNSNKPAGNCSTAMGGAGITNMTVTLEKTSDLSCAPVQFAVSAGASGTAATYTVNCTTPATLPCLNADQALTVAGVASGGYRIHVRGRTAVPGDCYINDDTIPVPALGMTTTRALNLAIATGAPGC